MLCGEARLGWGGGVGGKAVLPITIVAQHAEAASLRFFARWCGAWRPCSHNCFTLRFAISQRRPSNHERGLQCCAPTHIYLAHGTRETISADDYPCLRVLSAMRYIHLYTTPWPRYRLTPLALPSSSVSYQDTAVRVQRYDLNALLACTACHCAPSSRCMTVPLPLPLTSALSISTEPFS